MCWPVENNFIFFFLLVICSSAHAGYYVSFSKIPRKSRYTSYISSTKNYWIFNIYQREKTYFWKTRDGRYTCFILRFIIRRLPSNREINRRIRTFSIWIIFVIKIIQNELRHTFSDRSRVLHNVSMCSWQYILYEFFQFYIITIIKTSWITYKKQ